MDKGTAAEPWQSSWPQLLHIHYQEYREGLLIALAGASFLFGANGLGFFLMFPAILQWKRTQPQTNLPLENLFESLTTAIRYVRYMTGIKILLAKWGRTPINSTFMPT